MTYVDSGKLKNMTEANAEGLGTTEQDVTSSTIHRMRLSYNKCSDTVAPTITYYDAGGNQQTMTAEIVSAYDTARNAYTSADQAADGVVYIPETGELILSDTAYGKLAGVKDNAATSDVDEGEIRVTYEKDAFEKNDLRPAQPMITASSIFPMMWDLTRASVSIHWQASFLHRRSAETWTI